MPDADRREGVPKRLRVDVRIEADASFDCPITGVDGAGDADEVRINAVGDECVVEFQSTDNEVISSIGTIDDNCICCLFRSFDCVPRIVDVEGDTMLVRTYIEDRTVLCDIVSDLRQHVGDVSLERLIVVERPERNEETTVDLSALTPKQREALELAVFRGYFDGETALGEIAAELEISKSALSQRLRSGEAKLVRMALADG